MLLKDYLFQHHFQSRHTHSQKPAEIYVIHNNHFIIPLINHQKEAFPTFGPLRGALSKWRALENTELALL